MKRFALITLAVMQVSPVYAEATPVSVKQLAEMLTESEFSAPATVQAVNSPDISSEITGRVEEIYVQVGDQVEKGDKLVGLDCRVHQSRLKAALAILGRDEAQLTFASTQLKRAAGLKNTQSISEEILDQRNADLLGARADHDNQLEQVSQAEINVERCIVRAPVNAVIVTRNTQIGELANPGTPLVSLVQLDNPEVSAQLNYQEARSLQQAKTVYFRNAEEIYPVKLRSIIPLYDETTRTRESRLDFIDKPAYPGSSGRLVWQGTANQLPADYLVRREGVLGLFLAEKGVARFHALPEAEEGQAVEVKISGEQLVVTEGHQRLQDGDAIEVTGEAR